MYKRYVFYTPQINTYFFKEHFHDPSICKYFPKKANPFYCSQYIISLALYACNPNQQPESTC